MSKVMYVVDGIEIVEQYNGVELVSITIDGSTTYVGSKDYENKTIDDIVKYLIDNVIEIVKNGILITDIVEEPMAHPHYHSRSYNTIEFDEDDCGVIGILYDGGCSGSPSAWNHYKTCYDLTSIAEWILHDILCAEEVIDDYRHQVTVNKDLWNIYISHLTWGENDEENEKKREKLYM